jgi:hypothetical protein
MLSLQTYPTERKQPSTINRLYVFLYLSRKRAWLTAILVVSAVLLMTSLMLTVIRRVDDNLPGWLVAFSWLATFVSLVSSGFRLRAQYKALQAAGISPAFDPDDFHAFMDHVTLHDDLVNSGYEVVRGGIGKNVLTGDRFTGASAVSAKVNRLLWDNQSPEFDVSVPPDSRSFLLGRYKTWPLPSRLDPLVFPTVQQVARNRSLANESKIRLCEDLRTPASLEASRSSGLTICQTS